MLCKTIEHEKAVTRKKGFSDGQEANRSGQRDCEISE